MLMQIDQNGETMYVMGAGYKAWSIVLGVWCVMCIML